MAKFYYGGQAVMEGVMMRGRKQMAIAVRAPNGEIVMHEEPLTAAIYTRKWGQWPFVRGLGMLWDALGLGIRALIWSADVSLQEEGQEPVKFSGPVAWTTIAFSLALAVGIFFLLPTMAAKFLAPLGANALAVSLVEGTIRLTLFLVYLWAIGFMPDIRRVFCLSRRRTQDDQRVRSRRPADPGERGALQHVAHPLRHELPAHRDDHLDLRLRAVSLRQPVSAAALPDHPDSGGGRDRLRVHAVHRRSPQLAVGACAD